MTQGDISEMIRAVDQHFEQTYGSGPPSVQSGPAGPRHYSAMSQGKRKKKRRGIRAHRGLILPTGVQSFVLLI
jgi:hypothetical protein